VLSSVSGLRPVSSTSAFALWRVTGLSARVRVAEPNGTVVAVRSGQLGVSGAQVPAAGGTIELAEPAGGWDATLNGKPLTAVASPAGGWAQAFRLPPGGGVLDISRDQTGRDLILALEFLAVAAVAVLALPGSRAAADESAPAAAAPRARAGSRGRAAPGDQPADATAGAEEAARHGGLADRPKRGRVAARGGRAGRKARRDGGTAPGPRRGRRAAAPTRGAEPAGRRSAAAAGTSPGRGPADPGAGWPAGGPPSSRRPWPTDQPADPGAGWPEDEDARSGWPEDESARSGWPVNEPADPSANWPDDAPAGPGAGWPEDEQAGWPADEPAGPGAGWPSAGPAEPAGWPANERGGRNEPAGGLPPAAAPRSPSGTWPPPDQTERWGPQPGWPAPDPSGWSTGRGEVLDPLPPGRGSRHSRPDPDDDEGAAGWPVPERDWGGDAW